MTGAAAAPAGWTARELRYRHPGAARPAVDGVTLDVPPARLTAVLGPNGAGKSTLLALLLGTLPPAAGSVAFAGRPLGAAAGAWPRAELARRVGVVPQGEEFAFPLTVRDLVEMGRYPHLGRWEPARAADRAVVDAAIARVGMQDFAERAVGTLSGGERQRARLARALAQVAAGPSGGPAPGAALALDEPTAALDLAHEMEVFGLVRALADAGTTVLLVTHNLNLAARHADQLVLMHEGRVAAAGAPADVLTAERVSHVYGWPVAVGTHAGPRGAAPQIVPLDPVPAAA
ncbi:hemin import ATP-binding protein HmuV [Gemmatimonadetes bacterium T265]|nr:hemin import ATP-binding protein HmuV [Gemmatimonadetes bacterium T265]